MMVSSSFKNGWQRAGNGMTGGTIVVQGDVGDGAGCAMKGGKIIIDGRCPTPPQGTLLRPLTATELKQINKELASFNTVLGADAFCLESSGSVEYHIDNSTVSSGDLSSIAITPMEEPPLIENHDVDTATLIFGAEEESPPVLCPYQCYLSFPTENFSSQRKRVLLVDCPISKRVPIHGRGTSTSNRCATPESP